MQINDLTPNHVRFVAAMLTLTRRYPSSITSWIRSEHHNADVGGSPHSYHLEGLAADCVLDKLTRAPAFIAEARALGLQAVNEGDHIHVELDYRNNRKPLTPPPQPE